MTEQTVISADSQILNSIQACPRKTELSFIAHLEAEEKAEALEKGSEMHNMLELHYLLKGNLFVPDKPRQIETDLNEAGVVIPRGTTDHDEITKTVIECGKFYGSRGNLPMEVVAETIFQYTEYAEHYRHDGWVPLAVEEVGSKVIYEDEMYKFVYNFKIDLIAERGNTIVPFDHKTSKRRSSLSSMSNQFMGYAWGLDKQHVIVNRIGFQKTLPREQRFERPMLSYTPGRLEQWRRNTIYWFFEIAKHLSSNYWPLNLTSCDKYSGCVFESICSKDPSLQELEIQRNFKERESPWDVARILEVAK